MISSLEEKLAIFNENKLLILKQLYECDDFLCGCDLVDNLKLPKNLISYHISMLKDLGYIEETRCGRNKNYRIKREKIDKVRKILEITELIKQRSYYVEDY